MTLTATPKPEFWTASSRTERHRINIVFTNNYTTDGEALDLTAIPGLHVRSKERIVSAAIVGLKGYQYAYAPGSNLTDGKIVVYASAGTQISQAAYPQGVLDDTPYLILEVMKA